MFYNPFTVKGFAKGLAHAQLKSLQAMQRRFPSLSREALYVEALSTRPGFTRAEIEELVRDVSQAVKNTSAWMGSSEEALNFRLNYFQVLVSALARGEYRKT